MLFLSSFMGIVVGDLMWLQALQLIGARACILLGALQPCVAAVVGSVYLGQPLRPRLTLGVCLTSTGLALAHIGRTVHFRAAVLQAARVLWRSTREMNARFLEQLV